MNASVRSVRLALIAAAITIVAATGGIYFLNQRDTPARLAAFDPDARPQNERHLFDYADILSHYQEGAQRYLTTLAQRFHIEALILTLPKPLPGRSLEQTAVDVVNAWRIGMDFEGRGLLLLLIDRDKEVKLEVTYALEDVFTDAFSGYIEDLQLRPYYRAGDLGTGLIAVMEELEQRAQLKDQGNYTPGIIATIDSELLAGGAGARRALAREAPPPELPVARTGRGARTPKEAWEIMLTKWAGQGAEIHTDVYTAITRLAMGSPDRPDPRSKHSVPHWQSAPTTVRQNGDHAVVTFGPKQGWDNAPFLFCNTGAGWKFDIVHQRRLVVMGPSPTWKIERGNYPYVDLLSDLPQSMGKDLPLKPGDYYRCKDDQAVAARIAALESANTNNLGDIAGLLELAHLNVITGRRPNHVQPLLNRLKQLAPQLPEPYRLAAIYNVNTFFQYETALKDAQSYVKLRPDDADGYNMIGFLHRRLRNYQESIDALERAIDIQPGSAYAYSVMARNYVSLWREAKTDRARTRYRRLAQELAGKAAATPSLTPQRLAWLEAYLARAGM
ncbi:MAG: TPM domain-containing protein [Gammaproteobacteria bacterium]|nr:TPM domain-containing protein [Gammaproteobacteria bacterium]MDH3467927.1 TPM domain-containing protein [Gammaproteobacteria bacterium]